MSGTVNTFTISLPVNQEAVRLILCLFRGNPGCNGKKTFSYSVLCRATGMKIRALDAEIITSYGKGSAFSDRPVIKNNQFIFSNQGHQPASLGVKLNIKAESRSGSGVFAVFHIDLNYTVSRLTVSGIRSHCKADQQVFSQKKQVIMRTTDNLF